jgi:hypothetical protein
VPLDFSRYAQQAFSLDFRSKILSVYYYFPELHTKRIICGYLKKHSLIKGTAISWTDPPVFRLRPNVSNYTIAHELTHLVQGNQSGIPHGEVACDIWTIYRMPIELLDEQPYYLLRRSKIDWKNDKIIIKDLCRQAIELRKLRRTYIVWLKNQIFDIGKNKTSLNKPVEKKSS